MSVVGAIGSFATGTYTVTRRASPSVGTDGRAHTASPSTFTILASVQPLSGRELRRLPEGARTDELKKLYTATALQALGAPDTVVIAGATYEVERVEDFVGAGLGGSYYKVIVRRVGV